MSSSSPARPRYTPLSVLSLSIFVAIHLGCLAAIPLGVSWRSAVMCFVLYWVRMFAITAGYHRYFSHRAYKTSRWFQFVLAWLGAMSVQKGPLWWASVHRVHHRWSDTPRDVHSPKQRGFWYSHVGWIVSPEHDETDLSLVPDLARYPELLWLDRHYWVAALVGAAGCYLVDGWRGVVWGALISTVILWHCTFTINSLAHVWGSRRYETTDTSRNNLWLALITLGEGWHNNHHHYMNSARQGFFWWEIDVSYYVLRALAVVGVVRDLKGVPAHVLQPKLAQAAEAATAKLAEARAAAEARITEARAAAEAKITEARAAAEARITEAKAAVEEKAAEVREAVTEAKTAVEEKAAEAKAAVEEKAAEVRDAVESAVDADEVARAT